MLVLQVPDLLKKHVAESEGPVCWRFTRASASAPCMLFFGELLFMLARWSASNVKSTGSLVAQLLTKMDGTKG